MHSGSGTDMEMRESVVEMECISDKIKVLKNKNKLMNQRDPLYVDSDLTKRERKIQARMQRITRE